MSQLRASGKEIYAFADSLSMEDYVLLSGATRISVVPTGIVWLTGIHGESPYVRGLLDKIGVTPDFLHCGDYKSAAEIFMREGPSPQAEEMQNWLLDSMYRNDDSARSPRAAASTRQGARVDRRRAVHGREGPRAGHHRRGRSSAHDLEAR